MASIAPAEPWLALAQVPMGLAQLPVARVRTSPLVPVPA